MSKQYGSLRNLGSYGLTVIRRSAFAAAYLLAVTLAIYLAPDFSQAGSTKALLTYPGLYLLAAITSHFSYEAFLPFHRWLSHHFVLKGYRDSVGPSFELVNANYEQIRRVGKAYLDIGPPSRRTERLEQSLAFRQMHTYLSAACVTGALLLLAAGEWLPGRVEVRSVGLIVSGAVFAFTSLGHLNRSHALGRAYADIFIELTQNNRLGNANGLLRVLPNANTVPSLPESDPPATPSGPNGKKRIRRKSPTATLQADDDA